MDTQPGRRQRHDTVAPDVLARQIDAAKSFGRKLRDHRESLPNPQRSRHAVAERAGVTENWVALIEAGTRRNRMGDVIPVQPGLDVLLKIADAVYWDRTDMLHALGVDPATVDPEQLVSPESETPEPDTHLAELTRKWPLLTAEQRSLVRQLVVMLARGQ